MKDNDHISPKEMITWFRAKAREFNNIAATLETTFSSANGAPLPPRIDVDAQDVSLESVRKVISAMGSGRAASVATVLHTSREKVQSIIGGHPEVFKIVGNGWIKVIT